MSNSTYIKSAFSRHRFSPANVRLQALFDDDATGKLSPQRCVRPRSTDPNWTRNGLTVASPSGRARLSIQAKFSDQLKHWLCIEAGCEPAQRLRLAHISNPLLRLFFRIRSPPGIAPMPFHRVVNSC